MSNVSNKFLKPNLEGQYQAQQSQVLVGLWTPYGNISPLSFGIWPNGSVTITYNLHKGAHFTKAQKRKIKYVSQRGVEVSISDIEAGDNNA